MLPMILLLQIQIHSFIFYPVQSNNLPSLEVPQTTQADLDFWLFHMLFAMYLLSTLY